MPKIKALIVLCVLLLAASLAYVLPRPHYSGTGVLQRLDIPLAMTGWISRDVSRSLNLLDERYRFVSDVFAREYVNRYDENLLFLVLDAGNFHNPKVCFRTSGSLVKDQDSVYFDLAGRRVKANVIYSEAKGRGTLVIYWLCIDGRLTDWSGQKFKELAFTLFNKKRDGLMVRLDVPVTPDTIDLSIKLAGEFLKDIANNVNDEQAEALFGKRVF